MFERKVSITPLGGMERVGDRNSYLIAYGHDALILDCGQRIPPGNFNGGLPDEYLPNFAPLFDQEVYVRGVLISHSHLDHAGALPRFFAKYGEAYPEREMPPVFASGFARSVITQILYRQDQVLPEMESLVWNRPRSVGPFIVQTFPVIHSTPGSSGFLIRIAGKTILYLGDCKTLGDPHEEQSFLFGMGNACSTGIDLLLIDSTNAHRPGHAHRESQVLDRIKVVMKQRSSNRIVIATFSAHLKRLRSIINFAAEQERDVFVLGMNLSRYLQAGGVESGWRWYRGRPQGNRSWYPHVPDNAVILATGAQAEEGSGILKILNGEVQLPWDTRSDVMMLCANTIPYPEIRDRVRIMVERAHEYAATLYLAPEVAARENYDNVVRGLFHASGHGMQEDMRDILDIVRPRVVVPVHAHRERRELVRDLIPQVGFELLEEGECITL